MGQSLSFTIGFFAFWSGNHLVVFGSGLIIRQSGSINVESGLIIRRSGPINVGSGLILSESGLIVV